MIEPRYKAYIGYSHADEQWAEWLQHALESYRVPARLAARQPGQELPKRLSPVFRDREDLSSASNLSDSLLDALRASDALIVVCSPAAAKSRWVNEEIRQFRALGHTDRILCMVVDGDPGLKTGEESCYPPALFEGPDGAKLEPLAADARDWADGKQLAKLKLISALLGVRLDDLRQRDLKRRRRWQAQGALVLVAAAVLSVMTISSRISEQRERESAEQMAAFVVELGEDLQSDVDLDTLRKISSRAMGYLQELDQRKLTPETSIKVGHALRQLGHVSLGQGNLSESLAAYQRSLGLFRNLAKKHPDRLDVLFELAQAEFYVGNYHFEQLDIQLAWEPWERYLEISRRLRDKEPGNRQWMLEMSYATLNLLLLRISSGQPMDQALLEVVNETVDLARQTLQAWPDSSEVISHYSNTLAWAANAELLACHPQASKDYRRETLEMALEAARSDPSSNDLRERLAYAHSGMAKANMALGELAEAERNRLSNLELLSELAAKDPTNQTLATEIAANRRLLAVLLMNTQRLETALPLMLEVKEHFESLPPIREVTEYELNDYSDYLHDFADLMILAGNGEQAGELLTRSSETTAHQLEAGVSNREVRNQAALLRYLWFELNQQDPATELPILSSAEPDSVSKFRSCYDADLSARLAIVGGNRAAAEQHVDYLQARQYRHPGFLRFCTSYQLCTE
jgi:tetratricopeptide (TPR) repeat protein